MLAHQIDELNDGGLRGANGARLHQLRLGEPVALKQLHAQAVHMLELLCRFDLLRHDLGAGIGLGKPHQLFCMLQAKGLHIKLHKRGHGQP